MPPGDTEGRLSSACSCLTRRPAAPRPLTRCRPGRSAGLLWRGLDSSLLDQHRSELGGSAAAAQAAGDVVAVTALAGLAGGLIVAGLALLGPSWPAVLLLPARCRQRDHGRRSRTASPAHRGWRCRLTLILTRWPVAVIAAALAVLFLPRITSSWVARQRAAVLEGRNSGPGGYPTCSPRAAALRKRSNHRRVRHRGDRAGRCGPEPPGWRREQVPRQRCARSRRTSVTRPATGLPPR